MTTTQEIEETTTTCRQCGKPCHSDRHYGYCLTCIRREASQRECRLCATPTYNLSRFCVACIKGDGN